MTTPPRPIGVTLGEPAGIGPDLCLTAWHRREELELPPFYVRANPEFLTARMNRLALQMQIASVEPEETGHSFPIALPVVPTGDAFDDTPGTEQAGTAASVIASIEHCVEDIHNGRSSAVVTSPINKSALYGAGFTFPGHTEFLGALAARHWPDDPAQPVMMIAGPDLMVVPVTIHIPLHDVPKELTTDLILETAEIVAADLQNRFGIENPRLALCGLNPHAGENGAIGTEDLDVIVPAIGLLKTKGIQATGPHPADTLFHAQARSGYDCVLGMYHDQVLVPAKTIGFDDSVNVTLGLPFIRTSPDHGTAYSLAGTGTARVDSFAAALRMAAFLATPGA